MGLINVWLPLLALLLPPGGHRWASGLHQGQPAASSELEIDIQEMKAAMTSMSVHITQLQTLTTNQAEYIEQLQTQTTNQAEYIEQLQTDVQVLGSELDDERSSKKELVNRLGSIEVEVISKMVSSPVAFTVGLDENVWTSGSDLTTVPYDYVILNHGTAYDTSTYTFTAPVRGLYFFSVSMGPHRKGLVMIVVNGEQLMMACEDTGHNDGNEYGGDATSGLVQLEVGGQVWVDLADDSLRASWPDKGVRNVFSGFLYAEL